MRRASWCAPLWLAAIALLAGACTTDRVSLVPAAAGPAHPLVYVAVGSTESAAATPDYLTPGWTEMFFGRSLPHDAELTNVSIKGAGVKEVLDHQVRLAIDVKADVASVWAVAADVLAQTPVAEYEADLGAVVHQLSRGGDTVVLVANAPSLRQVRVPTFGTVTAQQAEAKIDQLNEAIGRVVEREKAVLVDVHAASLTWASDSEISALGFRDYVSNHTAHVEAARLFGEAYASHSGKAGRNPSAGQTTTSVHP